MNNTITIVSGLPRSGTSMMMRMLEAGGMEVMVDNIRQADEDNPQGYYEMEIVKKLKEDPSFLDGVQGKAVKIVSMLLFDLPTDRNYNIIFMKREIREVLDSQQIMLERKGKGRTVDKEEMKELLGKHLSGVVQWLNNQKNMRVLYLHYNKILESPEENVRRINEHMGNCLHVGNMAGVVDTSLYRQRRGS